VSPGLVQLAALWCAGERAEEGAVCAERCCSSAHQHTASRPHHSGFAYIQTSGVQDGMSGTPINYVNSTDVPTYLPTFNSSLSMVVVNSVRLPTEHSLFHAHLPLSAERSFAVAGPRVGVCGTADRLL